jgi:hypothetical protein
MITEADVQTILPQYPSHAAAAGIAPRDWAIDRLSRMPDAAVAPSSPTQPEPPRELPMPYSDGHLRALDRQMQRGAAYQAEERRIIAAIEALDRQLLPLQQQRAALATALAAVRFQG